MLTTDLVRVTRKGTSIQPKTVSVTSKLQLNRAQELIDVFRVHQGLTRGALDEAMSDLIADRTDFKLQRGLAKLLLDRSTFAAASPLDSQEVRRRVFSMAAEKGPVFTSGSGPKGIHRHEVLSLVAEEMNVELQVLERALYGDLKGEEVLTEVPEFSPLQLLLRYNTALVQGILLRAHRIRVLWKNGNPLRLKAIFRALRFYRLIHHIHQGEDGVELVIDGPLSLFRQSTKYGLQMAMFFPALALAEDWEMYADVEWDGQRGQLKLSSLEKYSSHYRDRGTWRRDEEKAFFAWLESHSTDWKISAEPALFTLPGGEVWVPDFSLEHTSGYRVFLDWIGYWRKGEVEQRLQRAKGLGDIPRIVLLSTRLGVEVDDVAEWPGEVIPVKGVLPGKKIVGAAEKLMAQQKGLE